MNNERIRHMSRRVADKNSTSNQKMPKPGTPFILDRLGFIKNDIERLLVVALSKGGDFSELFFEYKRANSVVMEEDLVKESSERVSLGVGIRVLKGEQTGYGYTSDFSWESMRHAALTAAAIATSDQAVGVQPLQSKKTANQFYEFQHPFALLNLAEKIEFVKTAYSAAHDFDVRIQKVQAHLADELQDLTIANSEGLLISDTRPQVRLIVIATAEEGSIRNTALSSGGGRIGTDYFDKIRSPRTIGREAAEEAITLLSAVDANPGEQPVVLGSKQSGVMIHEAVGHPLEADANRKKTSVMWDKMGKQVAAPVVTIYDDPTLSGLRGSINIDDEGTDAMKAVLIEKGKLVGLLQDRLSAGLMNQKMNGHARRGSYQDVPIPRMTNTVLAPGNADHDTIVRSIKRGFYAVSYQGGQVQDSGKFTFSVNLGYLIENGELTRPVRNATLIGTNLQILNDVELIGNDTGFFLGTCGKEGQSAPVTAGTPTLKIRNMTVGGRQ